MPRSKIIYGDEVLIDLTGDTVTADTLAEGVTAHDAAGNAITGTMAAGGGAKIAAGIVSAGSDGIIAVSGLDFTPVHLYLIRKFQSNTSGRMNYMIDGMGYSCTTSTSQTERPCNVTLSPGSFSVAQTSGTKPSGDYYYIVWS